MFGLYDCSLGVVVVQVEQFWIMSLTVDFLKGLGKASQGFPWDRAVSVTIGVYAGS